MTGIVTQYPMEQGVSLNIGLSFFSHMGRFTVDRRVISLAHGHISWDLVSEQSVLHCRQGLRFYFPISACFPGPCGCGEFA